MVRTPEIHLLITCVSFGELFRRPQILVSIISPLCVLMSKVMGGQRLVISMTVRIIAYYGVEV